MQKLVEAVSSAATANNSGSTSLHYASLTRKIEAARILVNAGAELVARNKYERTAMDEALQAGHRDGADYLMKRMRKIWSTGWRN